MVRSGSNNDSLCLQDCPRLSYQWPVRGRIKTGFSVINSTPCCLSNWCRPLANWQQYRLSLIIFATFGWVVNLQAVPAARPGWATTRQKLPGFWWEYNHNSEDTTYCCLPIRQTRPHVYPCNAVIPLTSTNKQGRSI